MAKKLSKAQLAIIAGSEVGGQLYSDPLTNTQQRSIDAMLNRGHLKITGRVGRSMIEYTIQDTPEVRAAIAQPVSVATDAAPAWTPKPDDRIVYNGDLGSVVYVDDDGKNAEILLDKDDDPNAFDPSIAVDVNNLAPAPDAAQTAAADADDFEPDGVVRSIKRDDGTHINGTWIGASLYINAMQVGMEKREQAEQIAALTRELEAAKAEADALRHFYDLARNLDLTSDMYQLCWEQGGDVATEYIQMMEDLRQVGVIAPDPDAALVAARQRADDGTRTNGDDVLAMYADDDAAVLPRFKFKEGDKVFIAREANTALCNGIIQQAQRDAYKCTIDRVFQSIAGVELYTVRYGNATDDFSEDELIEAQS